MFQTQPPSHPGVLVGVDGSADSSRALAWAIGDAEARGCAITVLHAWRDGSSAVLGGPDRRSAAEIEGERILRAAREQMWERELLRGRTRMVLQEGRASGLLEAASGAAVEVVLGRSGRQPFDSLLIGSTSRTVAARAPVPVVVVPLTSPPEPDRDTVVVGVDGEHDATVTIAFAIDVAARYGSTLEVVCAWDTPSPSYGPLIAPVYDGLRDQAQRSAVEAAEGWQEKFPEVTIRTVTPCGTAARALVRRSERARMLVVGGRPHGFIGGLLGSVADAAVRYAPCPVVVVHAGARPGE